MKQHMQDDEFANTILLPDPPNVLNVESLKAIRDGDALIATAKPSRSNAKIARHPIGGLLRAIQLYEQIRLDLRPCLGLFGIGARKDPKLRHRRPYLATGYSGVRFETLFIRNNQ